MMIDFNCDTGYEKNIGVENPLQCKAGALIPKPPKCLPDRDEAEKIFQNEGRLSEIFQPRYEM